MPYYNVGEVYPADGGPGVPIQLAADEAVLGFGRYGTGWIAIVYVDHGPNADPTEETRIYDATGKQVQSQVHSTLTIPHGQDGSTAISSEQGGITLVDASGTVIQTWEVPKGTEGFGAEPLAVLPDHSVVFTALTADGQSVETLRAMPDGTFQPLGWGRASDVNPTNLDLAFEPAGQCTLVTRSDPQQLRWKTCPYGHPVSARTASTSPPIPTKGPFASPSWTRGQGQ